MKIIVFYDPEDFTYAVATTEDSIDYKISWYPTITLYSWNTILPISDSTFKPDHDEYAANWLAYEESGFIITTYEFPTYHDFVNAHPELFI